MRRWKTTELLSKKGLKMWYCSVESNSCCTSRAVESEAGLWGYSHLRAFFSQEHETAIFHASMNTLANSHTNVVDFVCVIFRQKNWRSSVSRFSKIPASVNTYNMFVSSQTEPPPPRTYRRRNARATSTLICALLVVALSRPIHTCTFTHGKIFHTRWNCRFSTCKSNTNLCSSLEEQNISPGEKTLANVNGASRWNLFMGVFSKFSQNTPPVVARTRVVVPESFSIETTTGMFTWNHTWHFTLVVKETRNAW